MTFSGHYFPSAATHFRDDENKGQEKCDKMDFSAILSHEAGLGAKNTAKMVPSKVQTRWV